MRARRPAAILFDFRPRFGYKEDGEQRLSGPAARRRGSGPDLPSRGVMTDAKEKTDRAGAGRRAASESAGGLRSEERDAGGENGAAGGAVADRRDLSGLEGMAKRQLVGQQPAELHHVQRPGLPVPHQRGRLRGPFRVRERPKGVRIPPGRGRDPEGGHLRADPQRDELPAGQRRRRREAARVRPVSDRDRRKARGLRHLRTVPRPDRPDRHRGHRRRLLERPAGDRQGRSPGVREVLGEREDI